jgi:hypothetical protein
MDWLVSGRYTRSQMTYGLGRCLGTAECGLGATPGRHSETGYLAHHFRPRTHHIAPGLRTCGYLECRSHFRWLLYRTPIGSGNDKKSRGIRSFRSRVRDRGKAGIPLEPHTTGARTGRFGLGFAPARRVFLLYGGEPVYLI